MEIKSKIKNKEKHNLSLLLSTNNNFDQTPSSTSINNPTATYSDTEHRSNLPVSINLHPADHSQSETLPATVSIPLG
jgi:hypothetical protein